MSLSRSGNVTVTSAGDGGLTIVFGEPSPFGAAELEFAGDGTLVFDPAAPDRLLRLEAAEPGLAPATLQAVLGQEEADRVLGDIGDGQELADLTAEPTPDLAGLARLGLASWLEQWSPLDIPAAAAAVDVGLAAQESGHSLLAFQSFARGSDFLVSLSDAVLALDSAPPAVLTVLGESLDGARVVLGDEHPLALRLGDLSERVSSQVLGSDLTTRLQESLDESVVLVHGVPIDTDVGALFTVDWAMVAARVASPQDGAIHMTRSESGVELRVQPAKYVDSGQLMGLSARLVDPDSSSVLATAPLQWDAAETQFVAEFRFEAYVQDPSALASAIPEVYSDPLDGMVPGPRVGAARDEVEAWRKAVWALTHRRRSHAAEVVLGEPLRGELKTAGSLVSRAQRLVTGLGGSSSVRPEALAAWRQSLRGVSSDDWPTGLEVPGGQSVSRPFLSEMVEVWNPELFEVTK
jgi:hypothetical protein